MKKTFPRWILYLSLFILYLLHNDIWFWHNPRIVLGFPVGLLYHIGFSVAASIMMILLITYAWPAHLEEKNESGTER